MTENMAKALCCIGFLVAGVVLMCNDSEFTGFGCLLIGALLAGSIGDKNE
jgi:hypothetical protein